MARFHDMLHLVVEAANQAELGQHKPTIYAIKRISEELDEVITQESKARRRDDGA